VLSPSAQKLGTAQEPRPLLNDLVWGNFNVVYTSTSRSKEKRSRECVPPLSTLFWMIVQLCSWGHKQGQRP